LPPPAGCEPRGSGSCNPKAPAAARSKQRALGQDAQGKGPVTIDGTDATHPVPFKDGYPEQDDSSNTSHDFALVCTFPDGVEPTELVVEA
jgi:hypothetical protein